MPLRTSRNEMVASIFDPGGAVHFYAWHERMHVQKEQRFRLRHQDQAVSEPGYGSKP